MDLVVCQPAALLLLPAATRWFYMMVCSGFFASILLILCTVSVICAAPAIGDTINMHRRHHHQTDKNRPKFFEPNEKLLWHTPCDGKYDPTTVSYTSMTIKPEEERSYYEKLELQARLLYTGMESIASNLTIWSYYEPRYDFLPTLRSESSSASVSVTQLKIRPKMWHRDMQVFVAAFQYLHKKELAHAVDNNEDGTEAHRLEKMRNDTKSLLCEIETVINATSDKPLHPPISRLAMNRKLKLHLTSTKPSAFYDMDKGFTQERYFTYIKGLSMIVQKRLNSPNAYSKKSMSRRRPGFSMSSHASGDFSDASTRRRHSRRHQKSREQISNRI